MDSDKNTFNSSNPRKQEDLTLLRMPVQVAMQDPVWEIAKKAYIEAVSVKTYNSMLANNPTQLDRSIMDYFRHIKTHGTRRQYFNFCGGSRLGLSDKLSAELQACLESQRATYKSSSSGEPSVLVKREQPVLDNRLMDPIAVIEYLLNERLHKLDRPDFIGGQKIVKRIQETLNAGDDNTWRRLHYWEYCIESLYNSYKDNQKQHENYHDYEARRILDGLQNLQQQIVPLAISTDVSMSDASESADNTQIV